MINLLSKSSKPITSGPEKSEARALGTAINLTCYLDGSTDKGHGPGIVSFSSTDSVGRSASRVHTRIFPVSASRPAYYQ